MPDSFRHSKILADPAQCTLLQDSFACSRRDAALKARPNLHTARVVEWEGWRVVPPTDDDHLEGDLLRAEAVDSFARVLARVVQHHLFARRT